MSGLPEVDIKDWEKNTTYANGYDAESPVILVCNLCILPPVLWIL